MKNSRKGRQKGGAEKRGQKTQAKRGRMSKIWRTPQYNSIARLTSFANPDSNIQNPDSIIQNPDSNIQIEDRR